MLRQNQQSPHERAALTLVNRAAVVSEFHPRLVFPQVGEVQAVVAREVLQRPATACDGFAFVEEPCPIFRQWLAVMAMLAAGGDQREKQVVGLIERIPK